ncbi:hypothetical protein GCM10010483_12690 [Actinokineospora diospyrosa]
MVAEISPATSATTTRLLRNAGSPNNTPITAEASGRTPRRLSRGIQVSTTPHQDRSPTSLTPPSPPCPPPPTDAKAEDPSKPTPIPPASLTTADKPLATYPIRQAASPQASPAGFPP